MKRCYIVYHRVDMDGRCGGAICYHFESRNPENEIIMIPHNYGDSYDVIDKIESGSKVYVVDYSLTPALMKKLDKETDLIWLDHHASAIAESEKEGYANIPGKRNPKRSGCELAWEYFTKETENIPYIIHMLGRYDVWDLSYEPKTFWINTYLHDKNLQPGEENAKAWAQLFDIKHENDNVHEKDSKRSSTVVDWDLEICKIIDYGKLLYNFQLNSWASESKTKSFELMYDDKYKIICMNGGKGSTSFHAVLKPEHDIMMTFYVNKEFIVAYSLYTEKDNLNMGKLARILGGDNGGGHAGSAGFRSSSLPWDLKHISKIEE